MKKALFIWILLGYCYYSKAQNMGFSKVYSLNNFYTVFLDVEQDQSIWVSALMADTSDTLNVVHALIKFNSTGEIIDTLWKRLPYNYSHYPKNLSKTSDGCYLATGNLLNFNQHTIVLYKYSTDSVLWAKTYVDANTNRTVRGQSVIEESSSGNIYLLITHQENNYDVNTMVMKLRSNGEEIWRRKYGGGSHSEIPNAFTEMPDGSILVGSCKSNLNHTSNFFDPELYPTWLFRIDTAGQLLNQWTNPDPMSWFPGAIAPTPDGGIVYAGAYTALHDPNIGEPKMYNAVYKLNSNFSVDWDIKLGNHASQLNFLENIQVFNSNFFIVGTETDTVYQNVFGVLYKIDLAGNIIFKKYFDTPSPLNELTWESYKYIYSIDIPNDSTILMAGEIRVSFSPPQPNLPTQYGWLIKTNLQGCLAPNDCDYIALEELPHPVLLRVWPNPATEYLSLQVDEHWLHSEFSILNLQGQTLQRGTLEAPLTILDVQNRPPGLYLLRLTKNGKEHTIKWIKQ